MKMTEIQYKSTHMLICIVKVGRSLESYEPILFERFLLFTGQADLIINGIKIKTVAQFEALLAQNFAAFETNLERLKTVITHNSICLNALREAGLSYSESKLQTEQSILDTGESIKLNTENLQRCQVLEYQKQSEYQQSMRSLRNVGDQLSRKQKSFILQSAIAEGNDSIINLFINEDFDLNFQNDNDRSSMLHTAIMYNNNILLDKLQQPIRTLNLNKTDKDSVTPLLMAITKGEVDLAFHLIRYNADIYIADKQGNSPAIFIGQEFFKAINNNDVPFIRKLLSLPIDLASFSDQATGYSPLYFALFHKLLDIAGLIFSQKMAAAAIFNAIMNAPAKTLNLNNDLNFLIIKKILEMGAEKSQLIWQGVPLVYLSLKEDKLPITKLILEASIIRSSIFPAIEDNSIEAVKYLLKVGNNLLETLNSKGLAPLMLAMQLQRGDIINLFKSEGDNSVQTIDSLAKKDLIAISVPLNNHELLRLSGALNQSQILKKLKLDHMNIQPNDLSILTRSLKNNQSLISFSISDNNLGGEGIKILAKFLEEHKGLKSFEASNIGLDLKGISEINKALANNRSLTILDMSNNNLGNGLSNLFLKKIIENCHVLLKLDLSKNNLLDKSLLSFAPSIGMHKSLAQVNLEDNQLDTEGVAEMVNALKYNCSLVKISFSIPHNSEQFILKLIELARVGQAILSVGEANTLSADLSGLISEKREGFKENLRLISSANFENIDQIDNSILKGLFITFKQLQCKILSDNQIFNSAKNLLQKIEILMHCYEQNDQETELFDLFSSSLENFKNDYDHLY